MRCFVVQRAAHVQSGGRQQSDGDKMFVPTCISSDQLNSTWIGSEQLASSHLDPTSINPNQSGSDEHRVVIYACCRWAAKEHESVSEHVLEALRDQHPLPGLVLGASGVTVF